VLTVLTPSVCSSASISAIVSEPAVSRAHWGVSLVTLEGSPIYALNEGQFFEPASNAKLLTTAAALALLPPNTTWTTAAVTRSEIDRAGRLHGDLSILGAGDPTMSGRSYPFQEKTQRPNPPLMALQSIADQIEASGVKSIDGDIVGDDTWFLWERYGSGWGWDDLEWSYGAPVSALTVNDNVVYLNLPPNGQPSPWNPDTPYYSLENSLNTLPGTQPVNPGIDRQPGSKVVRDYLENAGLMPYLEKLKFNIVGYGCTTCIGNSGPLPEEVSKAIDEKDLVVASVLSGNRNFEGRINSEVRANYLMSPPLVVAFALAGRIDIDLRKDAIGKGRDGNPVYLADLWPMQREVDEAIQQSVTAEMFSKTYAEVFEGDERWRGLKIPKGQTYAWEEDSTYIRRAPYFEGMKIKPSPVEEIKRARVLAVLGDSVTTDHISPAGSIKKDSPAGKYLQEHGVKPADFNSYGSRRGNHEVMVRGTFANVRLRNKLVNLEGGFTRHLPTNEEMSIFDASQKYQAEGTPLIILAGKEYGSGSSRDWAAKGPRLLGVEAVIAESYERIHRSNLVGMGVLSLQFPAGQNAESLKLTGEEVFDITGIRDVVENFAAGSQVKVRAKAKGKTVEFNALVRIDTPQEALYYANGGILQYVLRQLLAGKPSAQSVGV